MARKASVVIEKDEQGFYAWCPELKGCQSQGNTLEEAVANIKEAIELYLETLPADERDVLLSKEILTTTVKVKCPAHWTAIDAERALLAAGFSHLRSKGSHRTYGKDALSVTAPFHSGAILHPKILHAGSRNH